LGFNFKNKSGCSCQINGRILVSEKSGRDNNGISLFPKNKAGEVKQKKLVMLQITVAMIHLSATRIMLNHF